MNVTTTIGIDLAKNVFAVHGADERGHRTIRKELRRAKLAEFVADLTPCLIGMEACASSHFWARKFQEMGHTVRLMAPQFVKPFVNTNKNDAADAEAICEAVTRPNMRFVVGHHYCPVNKVNKSNCLGCTGGPFLCSVTAKS